MLSRALLEKSEEFLEQISNETRDEDLEFAIGSLRDFIEKEADGHTHTANQKFAYAVQCRLEEIWDLISAREKKINPDLSDYFDELMTELERVSEYEAERASSSSPDGDESDEDESDEEDDEW